MREYIKHTLYENSGLIIGQNDKGSVILGQNGEWVVLDKQDIKNIGHCLSEQKEKGVFDGFNFSKKQADLFINQQGDTVSMHKSIFQQYLQCNGHSY
jgi:hypothetical protein